MDWTSITEHYPKNNGAYFISGHEWFGIGIWENGKGWIQAFIGECPYGERGDFFSEENTNLDSSDIYLFLKKHRTWWKEMNAYQSYMTLIAEVLKSYKIILT